MRLLILTQYFPPEVGAPQTRLFAMTAELKRLGHEVEVVTAMPNYPKGRIFPHYRGSFYRREKKDGVVVHRVWLHAAMGGGFRRMLNYLSYSVTSLYGLLKAKSPDYVFVESPPLLLVITGWLGAIAWRAPLILNVADLWPESAVEMGFLKDGILVRLLVALENWGYRRATVVNAMTEGIRDSLVRKKGIPPAKVLFLPNGVDTILYQPRPIDIILKEKLGLSGKKIILYQGTQGHAHGLESVLEAARLLGNNPEIHFLFMGDGSERARLEKLQRQLGLRNVTFRDPVSVEQLPPYFSIAECGLASLRDIPLMEGARPAKMFPILASGKPLIFVGRGEGAQLVEQAKAGIVVRPGDPEALAAAVRNLIADPELLRQLGANGRAFVETNMQWSKLVGEWIACLGQVHAPGTPALNALRS
jgi:glycosyltransferase involved in cell wall biosynthesis